MITVRRRAPGTLFRLGPALLAMTLLVAACASPAGSGPADDTGDPAVTGSVRLPQGQSLSGTDRVEVRLEDVSRMDAPAEVLARQQISGTRGSSIPYRLSYDAAQIQPGHSYALRARIERDGRLRFINDTHTPALTRGAGAQVDIEVVAVPAADEEAGVALTGLFRYLADAAQFRDCRDGRSYPVAMEGAYIELERVYLNSRTEPESEVLVELRGRYLERPKMEGDGKEIKLIVDYFNKLHPDNTCAPTVHAELLNTYWKLVEIEETPVVTSNQMREAHFVLSIEDDKVRGHGGCNAFFGRYRWEKPRLSFSALGSTMKACPEGMETEQALLDALGRTDRYAISGLFLTLFEGQTPLARFEAVYF